jgi:hypothetical protein
MFFQVICVEKSFGRRHFQMLAYIAAGRHHQHRVPRSKMLLQDIHPVCWVCVDALEAICVGQEVVDLILRSAGRHSVDGSIRLFLDILYRISSRSITCIASGCINRHDRDRFIIKYVRGIYGGSSGGFYYGDLGLKPKSNYLWVSCKFLLLSRRTIRYLK